MRLQILSELLVPVCLRQQILLLLHLLLLRSADDSLDGLFLIVGEVFCERVVDDGLVLPDAYYSCQYNIQHSPQSTEGQHTHQRSAKQLVGLNQIQWGLQQSLLFKDIIIIVFGQLKHVFCLHSSSL